MAAKIWIVVFRIMTQYSLISCIHVSEEQATHIFYSVDSSNRFLWVHQITLCHNQEGHKRNKYHCSQIRLHAITANSIKIKKKQVMYVKT
jgi:hypothetical protein